MQAGVVATLGGDSPRGHEAEGTSRAGDESRALVAGLVGLALGAGVASAVAPREP